MRRFAEKDGKKNMQNWRTLDINDVPGYSWREASATGFRKRAYCQKNSLAGFFGPDKMHFVTWGVTAQVGAKTTCFEILYRTPHGGVHVTDDTHWNIYPYANLHAVFHASPGKFDFNRNDYCFGEWNEMTEVVDSGGHAVLRCPTEFVVDKLGGVNAAKIEYTLPARLCDNFCGIMSMALEHFGRFDGYSDAQDVLDALFALWNNWWQLHPKDRFEESKRAHLKVIDQELGKIESLRTAFQDSCERGAEAAERLNAKYGIDVQI